MKKPVSVTGKRLQLARTLRNKHLIDIAEEFSLTISAVQKWQTDGIRPKRLDRLAHYFGVENWVFTDEGLDEKDFREIILDPNLMGKFRRARKDLSSLSGIEASPSNIDHIEQLRNLRDRFGNWDRRYVVVDGIEYISEGFTAVDPFAVEVLCDDTMASQDDYGDDLDDEGTGLGEERPFHQKSKGKVIDLIEQIPHIVLLGDLGAGKTATLQYLAWYTANKIIENPSIPLPYPIYVELKFCSRNRPLERLLMENTGLTKADTLYGGTYMLLFDGLNEIPEDYRAEATNDIQYLLNRANNIKVVIATRPGAYHNQFACPAFILQPLTDEQIDSFVGKRFTNPQKKEQVIAILKKQPKLWQWGRNPLCLEMITRMGIQTGNKIPDNKGKLMQSFVRGLMGREKIRHGRAYTIKESLLAHLAFETRMNGRIAFQYHDAIAILIKARDSMGSMLDVPQFISEVIDNNLLTGTGDSILSFTNEIYQEYFAACQILVMQAENPAFRDSLTGVQWDEPLILYSGLTADRKEFIVNLIEHNLLLAAKSLSSSNRDEPTIRTKVEKAAKYAAQDKNSSAKMTEGLQALIEIGSIDGLADTFREISAYRKEHRQAIKAFVGSRSPDDALILIESTHILGHARMVVRWIVDALMDKGFQPYESERAEKIIDSLIARKWWYEAIALQTSFKMSKTLVKIIKKIVSGRSLKTYNMAIELIMQHSHEYSYLTDEVKDFMSKHIQKRIKKYLQGVTDKGTGKYKFYRAIELIKKHNLENRFPMEEIVRGLLKGNGISQFKLALDLVIKHNLENVFPIQETIQRLLEANEANRCTFALELIKSHNLENRFPMEQIIQRLFQGNDVNTSRLALDLIEQNNLQDRFPIEEMILKFFEINNLLHGDLAINLIERYNFEARFTTKEEMVSRLIDNFLEKGKIVEARFLAEKFSLNHKYTQGELDERNDKKDTSKQIFTPEYIKSDKERIILSSQLKNVIFDLKISQLFTHFGFACHPDFSEKIFLPPRAINNQILSVGDTIRASISIGLDRKTGNFKFLVSKIHKAMQNYPPYTPYDKLNFCTCLSESMYRFLNK
jgi:transcriptional regulator with XRE-family HTH domain